MGYGKHVAAVAAAFALGLPAQAADNTLLIRMEEGGATSVWHIEGDSNLSQDELLALEASAAPEGGPPRITSAGMAKAYETKDGVVIEIPGAPRDRRLLIDRDACGGVKVWHSDGPTILTEGELADLLLTALPGGGKRVSVGKMYAKGYSMALGVVVVIWDPSAR